MKPANIILRGGIPVLVDFDVAYRLKPGYKPCERTGTDPYRAIENGGDFVIPLEAVQAVHDGKVVIDVGRLDAVVRRAIAHAHDRQDQGPNQWQGPGAAPSSPTGSRPE